LDDAVGAHTFQATRHNIYPIIYLTPKRKLEFTVCFQYVINTVDTLRKMVIMKEEDKKRDAVLKNMLNTPPETNKEMLERRKKERKQKARDSLKCL